MRIPIIDADGKQVAVVDWKGSLLAGKGVISGPKTAEVSNAIAQRADLARVGFTTDAGHVRGWQGFEGYLNALNIALPAFGFAVDRERVEWPSQSDKIGKLKH